MSRFVLAVTLALTVSGMLGVETRDWQLLAVSAFLLFGGVEWLVQRRPPRWPFLRDLLVLLVGPAALIALLHAFVAWFRTLSTAEASIVILAVALGLIYLARKLRW